MALNILTLCYLIGSITFIVGLKMLSNPATARKGNLLAAAGMAMQVTKVSAPKTKGVLVHKDYRCDECSEKKQHSRCQM